jgi:hypothetical protein
LQPELAFEREHRFEPTSALENGMPVFAYVDLRHDPDGHWKTLKFRGRELGPCQADEYVGTRGLTGLYGSFPDEVWMTVDRQTHACRKRQRIGRSWTFSLTTTEASRPTPGSLS